MMEAKSAIEEAKTKERLSFFNQQGSKDQLFNKYKQIADNIRKDKRHELIARKRVANVGVHHNQVEQINTGSSLPQNVMQILDRVVMRGESGSI